jgi:hypothetical protein
MQKCIFALFTEFKSWGESYATVSCRIDLTFVQLLSSRRYFLWETDKLKSLSSSLKRLSASEMMRSHMPWSRSFTSCRNTVSYWRLRSSALYWKCARASGWLWWGGAAIVGNVLILRYGILIILILRMKSTAVFVGIMYWFLVWKRLLPFYTLASL